MLRMWALHLSQEAFLARTASEFLPHRAVLQEVLHSGSGTDKVKAPGSPETGSGSQRGNHPQATARSHWLKDRLRLVSFKPVRGLLGQPPSGCTGFRSLREQSRGRCAARREGGRRCGHRVPSRGRALGRKAWHPQRASASDSSKAPPTHRASPGPGCSGPRDRARPVSAASTAPASRGHPVLHGARRPPGGAGAGSAVGRGATRVGRL